MIKYFEHETCRNASDEIEILAHLTDDAINEYARENMLQIASATCYKDEGIFVVFKKIN